MRDKSYQLTALGPSIVAWLAWCKLGQLRPRTLDQYERDLARGALMFPSVGLDEWTDDHMFHVAASFKDGEMRSRTAAWRSFFNWAVRTRKRVDKPTDALPRMRRSPAQVFDVFTAAEIALLTGLPIRDGALLEFMLGTGARKQDCLNFQYGHWRQEATPDAPYGQLVFIERKGGKQGWAPATQPIAAKLAELAILEGLNPEDHLWYTRPGGGEIIDRTGMPSTSFFVWWNRCLTAAGVRYRKAHMTRHTFATAYLRNGGRTETLRLMLGHKPGSAATAVYTHMDMRDVAVDLGLIEELTF